MAARKLVAFVHVDGEVYGPGDVVTAKVARKIRNPKAWAPEEELESEDVDESEDDESDDSEPGSESEDEEPTGAESDGDVDGEQ